MEQDINIPGEKQEAAGEIKNKKGGRPKGKPGCTSCKVTLYLTQEEYALLTEFAKTAWWSFNYSGAARFLLMQGLGDWVRTGKKELDTYGGIK